MVGSHHYLPHFYAYKILSNGLSGIFCIFSPYRIDSEVERLQDIGSWRRKQAEKLKKGKEDVLPQGFDFNSPTDFSPNAGAAQKIQMRKDKRMARTDPARYCADRCVATGNCEVWEDMFEMAADEVQAFCNNCVLVSCTSCITGYLSLVLKAYLLYIILHVVLTFICLQFRLNHFVQYL